MNLDKIHLLKVLNRIFNEEITRDFNHNVMDCFDLNIICVFFDNKSWQELAETLDLKRAAYPLELATYYFNGKIIKYYTPLYIYASLLNEEGWVFDSCFIDRYLLPDVQGVESFLSLFNTFSNSELNIISQYIHYAGYHIGHQSARAAFESFWEVFYNPGTEGESIFPRYKNMNSSK
ncbi:hypothetical protein [Escherichia sp. E4742]|uniref:hypothetical protein n=1 Tax=Escherichia sp. E4742 TaxID=2044467 RepID=UPI00108108A8|nr:hypothetical protein [Escherichia sp. E4742]QCT88519.1 hypothetical protein FEM44_15705 [Escherichia sp. E4742]TGB56418.1 hypothetical protein CRI69_16710 [Escherichia sp. E4742]TLJ07749.1 hypothetical protein FEK62_15705 [Escherichia sp. E4742]